MLYFWGMRLVPVLLAALLASLVVAFPAAAKDGVVAHLENPAVVQKPAGTMVSVVWTLRSGTRPFGASRVYVRLRGRAGKTTSAFATELSSGRFRARLGIPAGGTRSVVIGLEGWDVGANGTTRADEVFPIANDPL